MKRLLGKRPSPAIVISMIALFVAMGGTGYAVSRNSVGANQLKPGAVTAAKLKRGAVTAGKIGPKSVVAGKLGANAVLPGNLGNGIISTAKISDGAVIASKIKNSVVTTNKLNNGAVSSAKLGDKSVTLGKLADGIAPLLGTLRTGQTLHGVFGLGDTATGAGDLTRGAVSFAFPLNNQPTVTVLKKGEMSANCSGLGGGQTPQANGGNLCVYVTESKGLDATTPLVAENNTRLGFGLVAKSEATGEFYAYGQWAVTAP